MAKYISSFTGAEIDAGIANANKIFIVNFYLHESLGTYTADKTYNEVNAAYQGGKNILASLTTYDFGEDPLEKTPNGPTYSYSGDGKTDGEQIIFLSSQPVMYGSAYDSPTYVQHDIIALRNNDTIIRVTKTLNYA